MNSGPDNKEIKISVIANSLAMVTRAIAGGLLAVVLMKILPTEKYGYYTSIIAFLAVVGAFADLGIGVSSSRYIAKSIANMKDVWNYIAAGFIIRSIFSILAFLVLFIFSDLIAEKILNIPETSYYIHIVSFGFLFGTFLVFTTRILQGLHRSSYAAIALITDFLLYSILSLILVLKFNYGIKGPIIGLIIGKIIGFIIIFILLITRIKKLKLAINFSKKIIYKIKEISIYAIPLSATTLLATFFTQLPVLIIGYGFSGEDVAYYGVPTRIITILLLPAQALIFSISSSLTHIKEKSINEVGKKMANYYLLILSIFIPLMFFILLLSSEIILIISNQEYQNNSVIILNILSFLLLTGSFIRISGGSLGFLGHPKIEAYSFLVATAILFILGPISLIYFGLQGMAYIVILGSTIHAIIMTSYIFKKYKVFKYINFKQLFKILILSTIFFISIFLLKIIFSNLILLIISGCLLITVLLILNLKFISKLKSN